jgi:iron complex transport system permease protein
MTTAASTAVAKPAMRSRRPPVTATLLVLLCLLAAAMLASATIGAANIPFHRLWPALGIGPVDSSVIARDKLVLFSIRLPRLACAAMIGWPEH